MNITKNTILITGGASGIGFSLAEHFLKADNEVIICGRRETKLMEAKSKYPELKFKTCDVTNSNELDKGRRKSYRGINPSEIGMATLSAIEKDNFEITVGESEGIKSGSRNNFDQIFSKMNR